MNVLRLNSQGPEVELLQSTLRELGYYLGAIDGLFGFRTHNSVQQFQKNFGLTIDGIVGQNTWKALMPYIDGYFSYKLKEGDTLYKISQKYNTTLQAIQTANPDIDPNNLKIDDTIIVPIGSIVSTDISYTSNILNLNLNSMKTLYPFLEFSNIGRSVLGKPLQIIKFGKGKNEYFYSATIHANEWITATLLMKFLENLCKSYVNNVNIYGINPKELFNNTSLYIMPMINPDGVDLVTGQISENTWGYNNALKIANNFPDIPFKDGWKANIEGIDLNLQFPAGWNEAKEIKYNNGFNKPAPRDFVGYGPLTAPESVALYNFTLMHNFRLIITYHTQGRIIFYKYQDKVPPQGREIGEEFSKISGYNLEDTPYESSFAGYKDWFINDFNKPGYTIEVGIGQNPVPISQFSGIYRENLGILVTGLTK